METWVHALEEDLRTVESRWLLSLIIVGDSEEGEAELSSLWARSVVIQKMKSQQPIAPWGNWAGPAQMVENTMYFPIHRPS